MVGLATLTLSFVFVVGGKPWFRRRACFHETASGLGVYTSHCCLRRCFSEEEEVALVVVVHRETRELGTDWVAVYVGNEGVMETPWKH